MPYADKQVGRERHAEYLRERYQNDPEYRERQKQAVSESNRRKRQRNRRIIDDAKAVGCLHCSEHTLVCLDFHHVVGPKLFNVGTHGLSKRPEILLAEIAKCVVVCANCHRKIHAGLIEMGGLLYFQTAGESAGAQTAVS